MRFVVTEKPDIRLLSAVVRRQTAFSFDFTASLTFEPAEDGETAGLLLDHNGNDYVIEYGLFDGEKKIRVSEILIHTTGNFLENNLKAEKTVQVLKELPWSGNETVLRLSERENVVTFAFGKTLSALEDAGAEGDARKLNVPVDGGMVGAVIGVYASGSGKESTNKAAFNWTEYRNIL